MTRPLTAHLFASLDLVVDAPDTWHFPYVGGELIATVAREYDAASTLLLGRTTYDIFASSWPTRGNGVPLEERLNGMEKVVLSDTLPVADWQNARVLSSHGDAVEAVRGLRRAAGGPITIAGSIGLIETLLAAGEIDEFLLLVHPVIVGAGRRLFDDWKAGPMPLSLASSRTIEHGVQLLTYAVPDRRTTAHE